MAMAAREGEMPPFLGPGREPTEIAHDTRRCEMARSSRNARREVRDRDEPGNIAAPQTVRTPKNALGIRAAISDCPTAVDHNRRSR